MSELIKPIEDVLVPMDFSPCSINALRFAIRLVDSCHARLHLLYVDDDTGMIRSETSQQIRQEFESRMADKFTEVLPAEQRDRYHAETAVRCGTAYHEIETYATEKNIDLIVLGSVGRSAFADVLLGSVANHVIRHASCPVVSVRQEKAAK